MTKSISHKGMQLSNNATLLQQNTYHRSKRSVIFKKNTTRIKQNHTIVMFKTQTVHKSKSQCHTDDQNELKCSLPNIYKCKFLKQFLG